MTSTLDDVTGPIARSTEHAAHNYHPLPVVVAHGRGRLGHRRRRPALPRLPRRLLGAELRPPPPGAPRRRAREQLDRLTLTSRAFHNDQLGPFCAELAELLRQGHGAADEHRRRGRRDRASRSPASGATGQGRARRAGPRSSSRRRQLPRPHHHDRRLLRRPGRARRLRPVHPGLRRRAVRRRSPRSGRAIDADTVAVLRRADPGRGRRRRPARRLPARRARDLRPRTACCSSPTRSSPGSAAPARPSRATTRASCPTCTCSARRSAAASCRSRRSSANGDVLGVLRPGEHGSHLRRQPARLRGRPRGRPAARRPASSSARPRTRRAACTAGSRELVGHGRRRGARRGLWAGVDIDPALGDRARRSCERLARARRARQGHARRDDPDRAAARGHPRRARLRRRRAGGRARALSGACEAIMARAETGLSELRR